MRGGGELAGTASPGCPSLAAMVQLAAHWLMLMTPVGIKEQKTESEVGLSVRFRQPHPPSGLVIMLRTYIGGQWSRGTISNKTIVTIIQPIRILATNDRGFAQYSRKIFGYQQPMGTQSSKVCTGLQERGPQDEYQPLV